MRKIRERVQVIVIVAVLLAGLLPMHPMEVQAETIADAIVRDAESYVGRLNYVYGGSSLTTGADCSGFVCAIFQKHGYDLWAYRSRLRSMPQSLATNIGTNINNALPGDIITLNSGGYMHVGIYAGNGYLINAANSKQGVVKKPYHYYGSVYAINRVNGTGQSTSDSDVQTVVIEKPTVGAVQIEEEDGKIKYYSQVTVGGGGASASVIITKDTGAGKEYSKEIINNSVSGYIDPRDIFGSSICTVTVTVKDKYGQTASNSTSFDTEVNLQLNASTVNLKVGESFQFEARVTGIGIKITRIKWYGRNLKNGQTAVSVTEDGKATAYLPGEYEIECEIGYERLNENGFQSQGGIIFRLLKISVTLDETKIESVKCDDGVFYYDYKEVSGAEGYEVREEMDNGVTRISRMENGSTKMKSSFWEDGLTGVVSVRAYKNVDGKTYYGGWSDTYPIAMEWEAPVEPEVLSLTRSGGSNVLKWKAVPKVAHYNIYRKDDTGRWKKLGEAKANSFQQFKDSAAVAGKIYSYSVSAVYGKKESTYNNFGKRIIWLSKPKISNLKKSTKTSIKIFYPAVEGADGYEIKYSTSSSLSGVKTVTTKSVGKSIKKLSKGKKYYVRIRAFTTLDGKKYYSKWSKAKRIKL